MLGGRHGNECTHLLQHLVHRKARRQDAALLTQFQGFDQPRKFLREPGQTQDVVARVLRMADLMRGKHEAGQITLHPEQLVDRVVVIDETLALDLILQIPVQHVVAQLLVICQGIAVVVFQHFQRIPHQLGLRLGVAR